MNYKVKNHRLTLEDDTPVDFQQSPNQSGNISPQYIVIHFTRGASASSSISWLRNPEARASAHLVIGKGSDVTQLVAFNKKAWHAGRSRWHDLSGLNSYSIGIELDNFGDLKGGQGDWTTGWDKPVDDNHVIELPHKNDGIVRGWNKYNENQLVVAADVCKCLVTKYNIKDVIGHDDISPGRKLDPGPAFPMASFRSAVMGREADEEVFVTTAHLNIRQGPGTNHEKLDAGPLPPGTRLEVISAQGVWREVDVLDVVNGEMDIVGWVHGRYISPE